MENKHTAGSWNFAADSYGKVRHSKMACVYTVLVSEQGEEIVSVAARIKNWEDAKLIAAAPHMMRVLQSVLHQLSHGEASDIVDSDMAGDAAVGSQAEEDAAARRDLQWCRREIQEVLQLMA